MQTLPFYIYIMFNIVTLLPVLNSLFNSLLEYDISAWLSFSCWRGKLLHKPSSLKGICLDEDKLALLLVLNKEKTGLVEEALQLQETVRRGI